MIDYKRSRRRSAIQNRARRTRSRRRSRNRGKEIIVSVLFLIIGVILAAGLVWGGFYIVKRWKKNSAEPVRQESSRDVIPESFPDGDLAAGAPQSSDGKSPQMKAMELLANMSLEEKVAQLFIITPEALTGYQVVTAAGEVSKQSINEYPVGGLVYFKQNLQNPGQVKDMLIKMKKYSIDRSGVPAFLSVDEEGGTVARIGEQSEFAVPQISDMAEIGASNDSTRAYDAGNTIGKYLAELGFNLDYAPVADVYSNPDNTVVAKRSFGKDGSMVSAFAMEVVKGLEENGVSAVLKHFPGHGATKGDTHEGYAYTEQTLEEMLELDLVPFKTGIDAGIDFIMVGHISAPNVIGDETPSSLSEVMVTDVLRNQLGYHNLVVTDALNMEAIKAKYTSEQAAVKAIQAGVDLLLMPEDFQAAYRGIINAVKNQQISEERIDESVLRILTAKYKNLM